MDRRQFAAALVSALLAGCTAMPNVVSPSTEPSGDPIEEGLPDDVEALVAGVPLFGEVNGEISLQFLGGRRSTIPAAPGAIVVADQATDHTFITVAEGAGNDDVTVSEFDAASGALRVLATIDPETATTFSRSRDGRDLLAGGARVIRVDLTSGTTTELIDDQTPPELEDGPRTGWDFHWSPSGLTVAARTCGMEICVVDLISTRDWTVRRLPLAFPLVALTDTHAIGYASHDDRQPRLLDLATFELVPVAAQLQTVNVAFPTDEGRFVMSGSSCFVCEAPRRGLIVRLDPSSMDAETIHEEGAFQEEPLYPGWTSDDWVLLTSRPFMRLIHVETGETLQFMVNGSGAAVTR